MPTSAFSATATAIMDLPAVLPGTGHPSIDTVGAIEISLAQLITVT
jgi:hypothetical protein